MVTEKLSLLSMVLVSAAFGLAAVANAETEMRVETLRVALMYKMIGSKAFVQL